MKSIAILLTLCSLASAQTNSPRVPKTPVTLKDWNDATDLLRAKSAADQAAKEKAELKRVKEKDAIDAAAETSRQNEIKAEAGQYSSTMRYAAYLERATNTVPSPSKLSELYLKELGEFNVTVETNRRSGTINYQVTGCQSTNINAVFRSLKQMPNRVRISAGTNSVMVAVKLPTAGP